MTGAPYAESFRSDFLSACVPEGPARQFCHRVAELAAEDIAPQAAEHDRGARHPEGSLRALAQIGAAGVLVPQEYGGLGHSQAVAALVVETVASACPSTAAILMFHYQVVLRTLRYGREPWRSKDLENLASGRCFGSSAWTEIGAGADKRGIRTTLALSETEGRVNGEKHFCTGLDGAGLFHVLVATGDHGNGSSSFVRIPSGLEGVDIPEIYPLLGLRASSTGTLALTNVRVDPSWIIGEIGDGPALMRHNHTFLMNPGLLGLGIGRAALANAKATVTGRDHGSRDISGLQSCRFGIAEMETLLAQAYALATLAVACPEGSDPQGRHAANLRLKMVASRAAVEIAQQAMLLAGGRGFHKAWPYERHLRNAYATMVMGPPDAVIKDGLASGALACRDASDSASAQGQLEKV